LEAQAKQHKAELLEAQQKKEGELAAQIVRYDNLEVASSALRTKLRLVKPFYIVSTLVLMRRL
jgi:hypothetical protein